MQRQITDARIGSIVLSKGHLSVFDLPWLKEIFSDSKALQDLQNLWSKSTTITQQQKLVMRIMRLMPFPIQSLLDAEGTRIWAVLNPESLLISARSLFLEFGSSLSGEWAILGTVDAIPSEKEPEERLPANHEAAGTLFDLMRHFDSLSEALGRPRIAYGVTPIIIFRQVQAMSGKPSLE